LFALVLWFGLERIGGCITAFMRDRGFRGARDQVFRIGFLSAISMSAILVFGGIIMLAIWSFSGLWQFPDLLPQNLSTRSWTRSLPRIIDPLVTTLIIGFISTLVAVVLTILCLERENQTGRTGGHRALALIYLPLIIPQLSFVFGLQVFAIGFGVDGKFYTLAFVHLIFVLPYVFLSLSDSWRALDKRYDIIATGLGKNRFQVLMSIRIPLLTRAILSAAAVGFAVSVSQYLPTVLIGAGRIDTITTEAISLASGGNRRVIGVYAFLQTLLPFLAFTLVSIIPALLFRNRRAMRV
jgi:putative thiamine transport system permease protein